MKKAISLLLLAICVCGMMGCEKAAGPEVEINYEGVKFSVSMGKNLL